MGLRPKPRGGFAARMVLGAPPPDLLLNWFGAEPQRVWGGAPAVVWGRSPQ